MQKTTKTTFGAILDKIRILEFSSNGISGTVLKDTEGEQVYPPPRTEWGVDFSD